MKICIIGAGNMGGALALGLINAGRLEPSDITVTTRSESSLKRYTDRGLKGTTDNCAAVSGQDIVFIAVKPGSVAGVCGQIAGSLNPGKQIIVCIAAGIKPEEILDRLGQDTELVYVIPNTAVELGRSVSFISAVHCCEKSVKTIELLMSKVGETRVVPLELLNAGMALASCGIAYALKYVVAAAQAGESLGFSSQDSLSIVAATVEGAAALLRGTPGTPQEQIRKVATPGGHTEKGMVRMDEAGFTDAVRAGLIPPETAQK